MRAKIVCSLVLLSLFLHAGNSWEKTGPSGERLTVFSNNHLEVAFRQNNGWSFDDLRLTRASRNLLAEDPAVPGMRVGWMTPAFRVTDSELKLDGRKEQLSMVTTIAVDGHAQAHGALEMQWLKGQTSISIHVGSEGTEIPPATLWLALDNDRIETSTLPGKSPLIQSTLAWAYPQAGQVVMIRSSDNQPARFDAVDLGRTKVVSMSSSADIMVHAYSGLTAVHHVQGDLVMAIEQDKTVYAIKEPVVLRIGLAAPDQRQAVTRTIEIGDIRRQVTFFCRQAGVADWQTVELAGLPEDGEYPLKIDGNPASITITVNDAVVSAWKTVSQEVSEIQSLLQRTAHAEAPVYTAMFNARLQQQQLLARQDLEKAVAGMNLLVADGKRWYQSCTSASSSGK